MFANQLRKIIGYLLFQVAKKLSGHASRTAEWVTDLGNEHRQVLASILTAKEGSGQSKMASGLMKRYKMRAWILQSFSTLTGTAALFT